MAAEEPAIRWEPRPDSPHSGGSILTRPVLRGCKTGVPTPIFNFRLAKDRADKLREVSRVCGFATPSEFLRTMVGAVVSGKSAEVAAFFQLMTRRMGEQLVLDFSARLAAEARKPAKKGRPGRKRGRRPKAA